MAVLVVCVCGVRVCGVYVCVCVCERERVSVLKKNPPSLYTKEFSWPRFASRQEKRLSRRFCFTSFTFPGSPVRRGETTSFTTHRLFLSSFSLLPSPPPPPLLPPLYLLHTNSPSPSIFSLALCLLYPSSSSSSSSSTGESYLLLLEAFCKEDVFFFFFFCAASARLRAPPALPFVDTATLTSGHVFGLFITNSEFIAR